METIGEKIAEIRKRKGLTQEQLAEEAKINLRTLQRIENGETEPRGNTLRALCTILEINIEDVLDYGKVEDTGFLVGFQLSALSFVAIPLGNLIVPLILWLTKKDKIILLDKQGAGLLNFQLLWTVLFYVSIFILIFFAIGIKISLLLLLGLYVGNVIFIIVTSILVGKGKLKNYYPGLISIIK